MVAHRGAWERAPQNSLAALGSAIELGCEIAELDVRRRTRDGHLVALHDARAGQGAVVAWLDLVQLRERVAVGQAPLLEEMLARAAGRIALDVELKTADCARPALSLLTARLDPAAYVVTSFLADAIAQLPEARTGLVLRPGLVPRRLDERMRARPAPEFLAVPARLARAGLLQCASQREVEMPGVDRQRSPGAAVDAVGSAGQRGDHRPPGARPAGPRRAGAGARVGPVSRSLRGDPATA